MRCGCLVIIILIIAGIFALPLALAPRYTGQGELIYVNDSNASPNVPAIEGAADLLLNEGITVAIYIVPTGSENDLQTRIENDDLMVTTSTTGVFVIYIGMDNRYSEIGWDAINTINVGEIRRESLNPALRDGDLTRAIVTTLSESYTRITNPYAVFVPTIIAGADYIANDAPEWMITFIVIVLGIGFSLLFKSGSSSDHDDDHHVFSDSGGDFGGDSGGDSGSFDGGSWDD